MYQKIIKEVEKEEEEVEKKLSKQKMINHYLLHMNPYTHLQTIFIIITKIMTRNLSFIYII